MPKTLVAMSGGVDSSVAAVICAQTYGVKNTWGVHLNLAPPDNSCSTNTNTRSCCGSRDAQDAQQIAQSLGIYFDEILMHEAFAKHVIEDFVQAYANGYTPIPCTICNGQLKYKLLVDYADAAGYEYIATGHYVQKIHGRIVADPNNPKDQSYFLWQIPQATLSRCLFPVGALSKDQTRALAEQYNLTTAAKPDSQNLCFVKNNYKLTLLQLRPDLFMPREGNIVFSDKIISNHYGHWNYTIGQKTHGYYVVGKDTKSNTILVDRHPSTSNNITLRDTNFHEEPTGDLYVKVNSRSKFIAANYFASCNTVALGTDIPITPGQSAVLYRETQHGMTLVGGGWIK